jgi:hypothetical protein
MPIQQFALAALAKGHVLAKYGLQFFTISMFKGRCNQLKVLTGRNSKAARAGGNREGFPVHWIDSQQVR